MEAPRPQDRPRSTTGLTPAPVGGAGWWLAPSPCSRPNRPTAPNHTWHAASTSTETPPTGSPKPTPTSRPSAPASRSAGTWLATSQPATPSASLALEQFTHTAHYYSTLAHEHVHWTGHPDRLDRDLSGRFGSDAYAAEELVAELGAAMWSAQAGISAATRTDHAAYLAHWLKILRDDPRSLVTVASRAQSAVDHLNQRAGHDTEAENAGPA